MLNLINSSRPVLTDLRNRLFPTVQHILNKPFRFGLAALSSAFVVLRTTAM